VKKKEAKRPQTQADSTTITDLKRAVEELVSRRTKPEELEGTIDEAKALAQEWTIKESSGYEHPLFDSTTTERTFLLAALVVALIRDHKLIELMRRHFPNKLNKLAHDSFKADALAEVSAYPIAQQPLTAKQRSELKRRRRNRGFRSSIKYQFGGGQETDMVKAGCLPGSSFYEFILFSSQDCLDDIFTGCPVNLQKLEDLFDMDRHRLSELLQGDRKGDYLDVVKIMDALLNENRREKRKSSKRGRPPPEPWLNGLNQRSRVLRRIESRIKTIASKPWENDPSKAWHKEITDAFLDVVGRHLPHSGKKTIIWGPPP